ncbi:MAG: hypothetical protein V8S87_03735 [Oscillospiraceae bacterium]
MFAVFYFFFIRPENKKKKRLRICATPEPWRRDHHYRRHDR